MVETPAPTVALVAKFWQNGLRRSVVAMLMNQTAIAKVGRFFRIQLRRRAVCDICATVAVKLCGFGGQPDNIDNRFAR